MLKPIGWMIPQPWQSKIWIAEGNWPGQHHQSHIYAQVLWACVLVQMLQMSTVTQQLHHLCWMSCLLLLSHHPWTPAVVSLTSLGQTAAMITTSEATSIFSFLDTICDNVKCHLFWKNCNNTSLHTHFTLHRLCSILWVTPLTLFPRIRHWRYYVGCTLFTNPQYLTWEVHVVSGIILIGSQNSAHLKDFQRREWGGYLKGHAKCN